MTDMQIDLQPFCDTRPTRASLHQPWSDGPHTFATDGRALICVARRDDVPERPDVPKNCWNIHIIGHPNDGNFVPLPPLPEPEMAPCPACEGGKVPAMKKCPECKGNGESECGECGHLRDCRECKGKGEITSHQTQSCADCHGTGQLPKLQTLPIGGQHVDVTFLRLIRDLPDVQIAGAARTKEQWPCGAVTFKFTGGEGRIMPIRIAYD